MLDARVLETFLPFFFAVTLTVNTAGIVLKNAGNTGLESSI